MTPPITDMRLLGQLFRHPEGDYAKEVGDFIFASNSAMINCTIDYLALQPHQKVLEIGFGNGKHLPYLFNKESSLQYIGVETSTCCPSTKAEIVFLAKPSLIDFAISKGVIPDSNSR